MTDRCRKPRRVHTAGELANACGVGRATAYRWIRRGCPRRDDGSFDVDAVAEWAVRMRHVAKVSARRGVPPPDVEAAAGDVAVRGSRRAWAQGEQAEAEWRQSRAELLGLEVQVRRGELVPRADVAAMLRTRAMMFRRRFDMLRRSLPKRVLGLSDPREVDAILQEEFGLLVAEAYERPLPAPFEADVHTAAAPGQD